MASCGVIFLFFQMSLSNIDAIDKNVNFYENESTALKNYEDSELKRYFNLLRKVLLENNVENVEGADDPESISEKLKDGFLLAKLINVASPKAIDLNVFFI